MERASLCLTLILLSGGALAQAQQSVSALGRLEPEHGIITVSASSTPEAILGAVLVELHVEEGDDVSKGDLLAVIDTAAVMEALAESYRLIRSGLLLSSADRPPATILVTSMGQNEGKTSTTVNVARVLAQDQKRVLVIDCDLRRPRMHKLFRLDNKTGLSNYLSGNIDRVAVVEIVDEPLSLITSGPVPPNPSELLSSNRMQTLLLQMQEKFDFVLLDSPPIQSVTDSLALASSAEGTIVVVQYGKTTYDMLAGGMKKLGDVNAQVLGFVINGLKKGDAGSYYYGYSGYYKKYT